MKIKIRNSILFLSCIFCLLSFSLQTEESVSKKWQEESSTVFNRIYGGGLNSSLDSQYLAGILSQRSEQLYNFIDSMVSEGYATFYITEELKSNNLKQKLTIKFFSVDSPQYFSYYISSERSDTFQIPNYIVQNGRFIESIGHYSDSFLMNALEQIKAHMESVKDLSFTIPVIEETVLTSGCGMSYTFIEGTKKQLEKKHSTAVRSNLYRIQTYVEDGEVIKVAFQIPSETVPKIFVIGEPF